MWTRVLRSRVGFQTVIPPLCVPSLFQAESDTCVQGKDYQNKLQNNLTLVWNLSSKDHEVEANEGTGLIADNNSTPECTPAPCYLSSHLRTFVHVQRKKLSPCPSGVRASQLNWWGGSPSFPVIILWPAWRLTTKKGKPAEAVLPMGWEAGKWWEADVLWTKTVYLSLL